MPEPVVPSPLTMIEPEAASAPAEAGVTVPAPVRAAARRLLAADGREFALQPWAIRNERRVTLG